jgi:hypothetical protein
MFGFKKKSNVVVYRGYVIREENSPWVGHKIWFWQHDDAEYEHDFRRGWAHTLIDAKSDIDDQIAEGVK